jgi:ribosomal protein S18 acetylase RimI-like enzyme
MSAITIRKCMKKDKEGIVKVCFRTGYMGESAEGHFFDEKLFGQLFCAYYAQYEAINSFIAVIKKKGREKVVGYILCALDTLRFEKNFRERFLWRILFRLLFVTFWRYNHDFKLMVNFYIRKLKAKEKEDSEMSLYIEYPAHLHIDVLEEYQRQGIGTNLIKILESHLKENKVIGVCLGTSEKNYKSIPFYKKNGYKLLKITKGLGFWPDTDDVKSYYFGKKLNK